ncbi:MAG: D-glycero-beta-D-manno-heptose 1,7-bisphosphate 7-phosphatase [Gammaproteobacteria bacterium]|nr:D-glycero-beta-D-manno-heptose 1,7-bisphosphate 7-phosphatase [Gammaproteobacteria bacterium]
MSKLVILDRDGVINQDSDDFIRSPEEWLPIPGSLEAIARLCRAEYRVVVVTNQSGLARGYYDMETLSTIHARMLQLLGEKGGKIEGIFFCPHGPDEGCHCRKPAPGLFEELAMRAGEDLRGVPAVGDSLRDPVAAARVGALPVLVKTGKGRDTLKRLGEDPDLRQLPHIPVYKDLAAFVDELLEGGLDAEMAALGAARTAP